MDEAFDVLDTVEILDIATMEWSTTPPMNNPRSEHIAILLDDGSVLVAGGIGEGYTTLASSELFDPNTAEWSNTTSMASYRGGHAAVRLADGVVLVTGGKGETKIGPSLSNSVMRASRALETAEVYDPALRVWTTIKPMAEERSDHTSTVLSNGQILVTGGTKGLRISGLSEVFDPVSGVWTTVGSTTRQTFAHSAVLLPNGQVLLAGGFGFTSPDTLTAKTEVFDPDAGKWQPSAQSAFGRMNYTLTALRDGRIVAVGGTIASGTTNSVEYFDSATLSWYPAPPMSHARTGHTASLLPDGRVIVLGGGSAIVEILDPAANRWASAHDRSP